MLKDINSNVFKLVNCDTDAITIARPDDSYISKDERRALLDDLNANFPPRIKFEDNGYYKCLVVIKAKNYIMQLEDGTVKIKGSSLKDQKKEPALLEFIRAIIDCILDGRNNYTEIYLKYVKEIKKLEDIKRWATKRTITDKVLSGTRANETKVKDAIENSEYVEGDKVYMYYNVNDELKLVENFNNDYHIDRLLEKLYKTAMTFDTIIAKDNFLNFKLKRNKEALNGI